MQNYIVISYDNFIRLTSYLLEKGLSNKDNEKILLMRECINRCKRYNISYGYESDYNELYPNLKNEDEKRIHEPFKNKHDLFRENYKKIKKLYGENICRIESKIIKLNLEFIYEYIWYEDIMFAEFNNKFKMELARVLKKKQNFEKYIYKLLINEFPNDKIEQQYYIYVKNPFNDYKQPFRVDFYFPEYNIVVEADEIDHRSRERHDYWREKDIKKEIGCTFVRIKEYSNEKTVNQFINEIRNIKEKIDRE